MNRRCKTRLSGVASCGQETYGREICGYHDRMNQGLISLCKETFNAIERGTEGDMARTGPYRVAIRASREANREGLQADARLNLAVRERRTELEALLHVLAAGSARGWITTTSGANTEDADQREEAPRRRIRVWRQA